MAASGGTSANIILLNDEGHVLLQLRDDIPTIAYPNMWCLPGGYLEVGEEPLECIVREMREELGLDLSDVRPFVAAERSYGTEHTFWARVTVEADDIALKEGQAVRWFSRGEIERMTLGYDDHQIVSSFFKSV